MTTKRTKSSTKSTKTPAKSSTSSRGSSVDSTLYKGFSVVHLKTTPSWHPVKKMRYVFFRMIAGVTITDAVREIHWSAAEFWHLIDLKRNDPFRLEYQRAKQLQARAIADSVLTISEGRDVVSKKHAKRMDDLITTAMRRVKKSKSAINSKMILSALMSDLRELDKVIISRNKLQMDGAKWHATKMNPAEFSESSRVSLGAGDGSSGETQPILIQFVGRDGKVVNL